MQRQWACRAIRYAHRHALIALAALVLSACAADPTVTGSIPQTGIRTIAFESVDGPPRDVFDRLVAALSREVEARDLPVVSHKVASTYRVRAYLAANVDRRRRKASVAWTWDVFDAAQNLAFRLEGEEPLGTVRSDPWAQCDEKVIARIAGKGLDALSERLGPLPAQAGASIAFAETHP